MVCLGDLMIKYKVFAWGPTVKEIESGRNILLDRVEEFINEIGEDKIIAINGVMNAIIIWYKE